MTIFWVAALGRSGTTWLADTLNKSPTHKVLHEYGVPGKGMGPDYWEPFPIKRFFQRGPNYGECHGKIRRHLSPYYPGPERMADKRAVLLRSPRSVVKSWMNHFGSNKMDLGWSCRQVITELRRLLDYAASDRDCKVIWLEKVSTDLIALQEVIDWLDLGFEVTAKDQKPKNKTEDPKWEWTRARVQVYEHVINRFKGPYQWDQLVQEQS